MKQETATALFDGECNLCNGMARFLFERDAGGQVQFANLQSEAGRSLLARFSLPDEGLDSFVFVEGERAFTHSSGALRALSYLNFPWTAIGKLLSIIPRSMRDAAYRWIAGRRYGWFGKTEVCQIPGEDLKTRFLP